MAVIEASAAGGATNTNGAWVGGVQPTNADDVLVPATAGGLKIPTGTTLACRSFEVVEAYAHEVIGEGTGILAIGGATSKADKVACRIALNKFATISMSFVGSSGNTEKVYYPGTPSTTTITFAGTAGTTYAVEENLNTTGNGEVKHNSGGLTINVEQVWGSFNGSNSTTRTLNIENVLIKLLGTGTVWTMSTKTNLTFKPTGSTIWISNSEAIAKSFVPGVEQTYGNLKLPGSAFNPKIKITQSCTLNQLEFTEGQKVLLEPTKSIVIKLNRVIGAKGTLANKITIESATAATFFTFEARIIGSHMIFDFCTFKDVHGDLVAEWYAGANSTSVSGNERLKFEAAPVHEHALTITQAQSLSKAQSTTRLLPVVTQAQAISRATTPVKALTVAQAQTPSRTTTPGKLLSATQAQAPSASAARAVALSVTQGTIASLSAMLATGRTLTITQAQSTILVTSRSWNLSASQAQSASRSTGLNRILIATQVADTAIVFGKSNRTLEATQGQAVSIARALARALAVSQPQAVPRVAVPARILTLTQGQLASLPVAHAESLTATQAQAASLAALQSPTIVFTLSQGASASLKRTVSRSLTTGQAQSPTLARSFTRALTLTQGQAVRIAQAEAHVLSVGQGTAPSLARTLVRSLLVTQPQSARLTVRPSIHLSTTQAQTVSVVGVVPEIVYTPGKLTSSAEPTILATSEVIGHNSSSVEPALRAESSVS